MRCGASRSTLKGAFSLIEMLVVISVIGVVAAVAIPSLGSYFTSAEHSQDRRNAQSIAFVFQTGRAAGVEWSATTLDDAVAEVIAGKTASKGALKGTLFSLPYLNEDDLKQAKKYIRLENGGLTYVPH